MTLFCQRCGHPFKTARLTDRYCAECAVAQARSRKRKPKEVRR